MSDKQKDDTYSNSNATSSPRIVKNPLLSASVTGFSFDDFPNKPQLLPAAPPLALPKSRVDAKNLVTVGSSSDLDSESLDEINLNATSDEGVPAIIETHDFNNPSFDNRAATPNTDSILSQAASSFSALPSVASSVLSTFSKRIYSGSTSRERTPTLDGSAHDTNANPTNLPPFYQLPEQEQSQQLQQSYPRTPLAYEGPIAAVPLYTGLTTADNGNVINQSATAVFAPELGSPAIGEPPKFYSPADAPPIAPVATSSQNAQNTYRLAAKKKLYAPIPGLSDALYAPPAPAVAPIPAAPLPVDGTTLPSQDSQLLSFSVAQTAPPPPLPALPPSEQQAVGQTANYPPPPPERSVGLFSLTNLVPTGVLQNLSGLVQSAAVSLTQPKAESPAVVTASQVDHFGSTSSSWYSASAPDASNPPTQSYAVHFDQLVPPLPTGASPISYFGSSTTSPEAVSIQPDSGSNLAQSAAQATPASYFGFNTNSSTRTAYTPLPPTLASSPQQPAESAPPLTGPTTFVPAQPAQVPYQDVAAATAAQPPLPPPPSTVAAGTGPPPKGGPSSYRLQKGTRLYKSPLTAAETVRCVGESAPSIPSIPLGTPAQPVAAPFNPFGSQREPSPVSAFAPPQLIPESLGHLPKQVEPLEAQTEQASLLKAAAPPASSQQQAAPSAAQPHTHLVANIIEPIIAAAIDESQQRATQSERPPQQEQQQQKEAIAQSLKGAVDTVDKEFYKTAAGSIGPIAPPQTNLPPPPPPPTQTPSIATASGAAYNPFRRGSTASEAKHTQSIVGNISNFFTPIVPTDGEGDGDNAFNFFGAPQTELQSAALIPPEPIVTSAISSATFFHPEPATAPPLEAINPGKLIEALEGAIAPAFSEAAVDAAPASAICDQKSGVSEIGTIAPPCGFDNFVGEPAVSATNAEQAFVEESNLDDKASSEVGPEPVVPKGQCETQQTCTNFFKPANVEAFSSDPTAFFDSFSPQALQSKSQSDRASIGLVVAQQGEQAEDQRIQNFFNNPPPPPKEDRSDSHDLNYDLVHRGLAIKSEHRRSLTPASNIVEPPSSSCSEFSELNSSAFAIQKQLIENLNTSKEAITKEAPLLPPPSAASAEESAPAPTPTLTATPTQTPTPTPTALSSVQDLSISAAYEAESGRKFLEELPDEVLSELRMANAAGDATEGPAVPEGTINYVPAVKHWFYKTTVGNKSIWSPFSHYDSALLETSLSLGDDLPNLVAVEGGRYDVNIRERTKVPVYWRGKATEVRRCSWFFKATDSKYVPYDEATAEQLEREYEQAAESGVWHKKIVLSMGEQVVFHGPTVIVHFQRVQTDDGWGGATQTTTRPRVVKRELTDFNIEPGESQRVDHLLFMVHGIGSACDLKMRSVEEVVDDFRTIAQQLVQSHYKNSTDIGVVGRVEVLPIHWHSHLHSEELGIDEKLKSITLESIPKLRSFTNDTLLDVLFYTSPKYCQKIMNTVAASMNSVYMLYRKRHPDFNGGVSLAGHSLGSLILFDLLCHQKPLKESEEQNMENPDQFLNTEYPMSSDAATVDSNRLEASEQIASQQVGYTIGPAGTGQPIIHYNQLVFQPKKFFALGSPIGMFVTIRGIDELGLEFRLPTCAGFYNIFHPFDPVAYRIEALVNPDMSGIRPVLIPHHKGRKRMHLELKETMSRVGADLKQRFLDTFKSTIESVNFLGSKSKKEAEESMEKEVNEVLEMQRQFEAHHGEQQRQREHSGEGAIDPSRSDLLQAAGTSSQVRSRANSTSTVSDEIVEVDFPLGKLNDSKRIDYVLQEAPLEFFNEYVFALSSHVCYWASEDTILFVMKEIYSGLGISPDSQVPQQTMTIERPSSRADSASLHSP